MSKNVLAVVSSQEVVALDPEVKKKLAPRAHRYRNLMNIAGGCFVEAGLELIAASEEVEHRQWVVWLRDELGLSVDSARRYMKVADVFRGRIVPSSLADVTFEAKALYLLARSSIPQEIRDEAVERAERGERITLAEAEKLIIERVATEVEKQRQEARQKIEEAVKFATEQAAGDIERLEAQIAEIEAAYKPGPARAGPMTRPPVSLD